MKLKEIINAKRKVGVITSELAIRENKKLGDEIVKMQNKVNRARRARIQMEMIENYGEK